MRDDIARVVISHEQIQNRVRELANEITADHAAFSPVGDGAVTIIPILTGAMIFCADLIRCLPMRMKISLLAVSSYPDAAVQSQGAKLLGQQIGDVHGRHILLVDDIVDTGGTMSLVRQSLARQDPAWMRTCVLLRKATAMAHSVPVDYVGFDIPDEFVVGYGLDYADYYRNLPDIVTLKSQVTETSVRK